MRPRAGGPHTRFSLRLTARSKLGTQGVIRTSYRVTVAGPARAGCVHGVSLAVAPAAGGERVSLPRRGPAGRGGEGRVRGSVELERGPACQPGARGGPPTPCPKFATRLLLVGRFAFTVR
ncbi:MAG: hypothetical protein NVSMB51_06060 [Solirubrobacteraceae bacterium]